MGRMQLVAGFHHARRVEGEIGLRWLDENGQPIRGYRGYDYTPNWPYGGRQEILVYRTSEEEELQRATEEPDWRSCCGGSKGTTRTEHPSSTNLHRPLVEGRPDLRHAQHVVVIDLLIRRWAWCRRGGRTAGRRQRTFRLRARRPRSAPIAPG